MSTNKIEKVNSLLEQEIGKLIRKDFSFSPDVLVTLTRVESSSNLIEAKAYISVFPDNKADEVIYNLKKSIYDIQYQINRTLRTRPIPKIKFIKEEEVSKAARVEELLAKISEDASIEKE